MLGNRSKDREPSEMGVGCQRQRRLLGLPQWPQIQAGPLCAAWLGAARRPVRRRERPVLLEKRGHPGTRVRSARGRSRQRPSHPRRADWRGTPVQSADPLLHPLRPPCRRARGGNRPLSANYPAMKIITLRRLDLPFDAGQIAHGSAEAQARQAWTSSTSRCSVNPSTWCPALRAPRRDRS